MNIRDAVGKRGLLDWRWHVGCAEEKVDTNGAVVNLDAVQGCGSLCSLFRPVEDDGCASQTFAVRPVLHDNLLGPANTDWGSKIFLKGVLVVVVGYEVRSIQA